MQALFRNGYFTYRGKARLSVCAHMLVGVRGPSCWFLKAIARYSALSSALLTLFYIFLLLNMQRHEAFLVL